MTYELQMRKNNKHLELFAEDNTRLNERSQLERDEKFKLRQDIHQLNAIISEKDSTINSLVTDCGEATEAIVALRSEIQVNARVHF